MVKISDLINEYSKLKPTLPGSNLPWLQDLRTSALTDLETHGFPTLKTEDWKYTRVNTLLQQEFIAVKSSPASLDISAHVATEGDVLVFIDGVFMPLLSRRNNTQLALTNFTTALDQQNILLQQFLGRSVNMKAPGFAALNTALMQDGAVIHIPANVIVEAPIQLLFIQSGQAQIASHLRNLIILGAHSQASVIETYVSAKDSALYFTNAVTEIVLQDAAQLHYYKQQQESTAGFHVHYVFAQQAQASQLTTVNIDRGGKLVRNWLQSNLAGENAGCDLSGLYVVTDQQHVDNHTRVEHLVPHTTSREYYKGVLADKGRAVFNGQVFIERGAQKSDAEQRNRNLLLSPHTEIDTKPQLEIYADDVKCSHGATISDLSPEVMFYLRSRGLDANDAQAILLQGFMNEIVEKVKEPKIREKLSEMSVIPA